jgi:hypothetical protein
LICSAREGVVSLPTSAQFDAVPLGRLLGPRAARIHAIQEFARDRARPRRLQHAHLECVTSGEVLFRELVVEKAERLVEIAIEIVAPT